MYFIYERSWREILSLISGFEFPFWLLRAILLIGLMQIVILAISTIPEYSKYISINWNFTYSVTYLIKENSWRIMPSGIRPNENCWINKNLFIFQAFLFRENSPGGLLFYLYLATFKSYIIMTLNNERKLGTYVPSAFLFGQQFRPGGTFSNQVGPSLCVGCKLPPHWNEVNLSGKCKRGRGGKSPKSQYVPQGPFLSNACPYPTIPCNYRVLLHILHLSKIFLCWCLLQNFADCCDFLGCFSKRFKSFGSISWSHWCSNEGISYNSHKPNI